MAFQDFARWREKNILYFCEPETFYKLTIGQYVIPHWADPSTVTMWSTVSTIIRWLSMVYQSTSAGKTKEIHLPSGLLNSVFPCPLKCYLLVWWSVRQSEDRCKQSMLGFLIIHDFNSVVNLSYSLKFWNSILVEIIIYIKLTFSSRQHEGRYKKFTLHYPTGKWYMKIILSEYQQDHYVYVMKR